jgi:arginine-tRNA-protein transferase
MAATTDKLLMKFGVTQAFDCSYLPDKKEQLLVYVEETADCNVQYELLIRAGFRRSGEQIYRPHCPSCNACQSLRIVSNEFKPSGSQKRILNKNRHISVKVQREIQDNYYPLYDEYIRQRHADGSMYPPSQVQFDNFIRCQWNTGLFFEAWLNDELVAVSIVDELSEAYSALYTFFKPELADLSLGKLMIMKIVERAVHEGKPYVYLGYQIDDCKKMNYKRDFHPHERFYDNKWHRIQKK